MSEKYNIPTNLKAFITYLNAHQNFSLIIHTVDRGIVIPFKMSVSDIISSYESVEDFINLQYKKTGQDKLVFTVFDPNGTSSKKLFTITYENNPEPYKELTTRNIIPPAIQYPENFQNNQQLHFKPEAPVNGNASFLAKFWEREHDKLAKKLESTEKECERLKDENWNQKLSLATIEEKNKFNEIVAKNQGLGGVTEILNNDKFLDHVLPVLAAKFGGAKNEEIDIYSGISNPSAKEATKMIVAVIIEKAKTDERFLSLLTHLINSELQYPGTFEKMIVPTTGHQNQLAETKNDYNGI